MGNENCAQSLGHPAPTATAATQIAPCLYKPVCGLNDEAIAVRSRPPARDTVVHMLRDSVGEALPGLVAQTDSRSLVVQQRQDARFDERRYPEAYRIVPRRLPIGDSSHREQLRVCGTERHNAAKIEMRPTPVTTERHLDAATRHRVMASIRSRDTAPELAVRRAAYRAGLRYRLHDRRLPGCPDLVLSSRRLVVFVHGCFWHQHGDPTCRISKPAGGNNQGYWVPKLARNVMRDHRHQEELRALGWHVLVVWECESRVEARLASIIDEVVAMPATAGAWRA